MREVLRSRTGIAAGALLSLCLMAFSATAQTVDKNADMGDTVKIHVSGDTVLDMVYRSPGMTEFVGRTGNQNIVGGAPPFENKVDGETTFEGTVALTVAADLSDKVRAVPESCWAPTAASVAEVAWRRYSAGQRDDVWQLVPKYLRKSAAEEKWDAKQDEDAG